MVSQYPHTLTAQQISGIATANSDGDYIGSVTEKVTLSKCRAEINSGGAVLNLTDGTQYVYDSLIQLPKSAPIVFESTEIEVTDENGNVMASGTVKRFQPAQLHCRLWV